MNAIDMIYDYCLIFQPPDQTMAEDFQLTAKALLRAYEVTDGLRSAITCANGIHGWRGRMACELLAVSDYLVQAAVQQLIDGNASCIYKK